MAKEFLSRHGVDFVGKNILEPGIQEELERRGFRSAPVVFIGDEGHAGFDAARLSAALDLADARYATDALTTDVVKRHAEVLGAWARAVRQIPVDRLDLPVDMNIRSDLRSFVDHVWHVETTMRAREAGVWEGRKPPPSEIPDDPETIAADLSDLRSRFRKWGATLTQDELDRVCDGFYGQVTLARLLEHSLGRLAFHLTRLYGIMRDELGIEPDDPLDDSWLDEVADPVKMLD